MRNRMTLQIFMLIVSLAVVACTADQLQQSDLLLRPAAVEQATVLPGQVAAPGSLHLGWVWSSGEPGLMEHVAAGSDGTIFVSDSEGVIHAVRVPGEELWSHQGECGFAYPPALSADGTTLYFVAVGDDGPAVCALNLDGDLLWRTVAGDLSDPNVTPAPDGSAVVRAGEAMAVFAPDGTLSSSALPESVTGLFGTGEPPVYDGEGTAYLALRAGKVLAFSPAWELTAECDTPLQRSNLAGAQGGGFYVMDDDGLIHAYAGECAERWTFKFLLEEVADAGAALAVGPDGTLYAAAAESALVALDPADGGVLWQRAPTPGAPRIEFLFAEGEGMLVAWAYDPTTLLAWTTTGEPLLSLRHYHTDHTSLPVQLAGHGIAQIRMGKLEVYTSDPALLIVPPTPVPPPVDRTQAEAEVVKFMVDMIVEDEIEGTLAYIESIGGFYTPPTSNVIVWLPLAAEQIDGSSGENAESAEGGPDIPKSDAQNPLRVWSYAEGRLTEEAEMVAVIEEYRATHMTEANQSIFAWGFYDFTIESVSPDLMQAQVYLGASCGMLCGHGIRFTLDRAPDGLWTVAGYEDLWQS